MLGISLDEMMAQGCLLYGNVTAAQL